MRSPRSSHQAPNARAADHASVTRVWFLLDSDWHDPVWIFKPTNALEESRPIRLHWNFTLPSGPCFADERYARLLQTPQHREPH